MGLAHRRLDKIELIAIHHSASPRTTTLAEIEEWHRAKGWTGIGYNVVIDHRGRVHVTRSIDTVPAANRGVNIRSIAICVTGSNDRARDAWNATQRGALVQHVARLRVVLGRRLPIYGHGHLPGQHTSCPGLGPRAVEALFA